jgi:hypothetical protein
MLHFVPVLTQNGPADCVEYIDILTIRFCFYFYRKSPQTNEKTDPKRTDAH